MCRLAASAMMNEDVTDLYGRVDIGTMGRGGDVKRANEAEEKRELT
jgi:hypothetical protein